MKPFIDRTMLEFDIRNHTGDERHRVRAHRVVEYMRHHFPAVHYNDAPEDLGERGDRRGGLARSAPRGPGRGQPL
jgi:hypothetical protein